ncbi:hypothetical protein SASPL_108905 [Salvia splendens]|uniref:DUF630 domain-containing protein n=1 Tax=Salvia splendens TaxID=180675 RepID=A0A8X9A5T7_SALSN|nr:hypothetical protein SASPL_108905 [Salvia splendens]
MVRYTEPFGVDPILKTLAEVKSYVVFVDVLILCIALRFVLPSLRAAFPKSLLPPPAYIASAFRHVSLSLKSTHQSMGCATSKPADSPAVLLYRERCCFLDEVVRQRFAFAEAHMAYLHTLKEVGVSLDRFFSQDLEASFHSPPSPVFNLPAHRKGDSPSPPDKIHHHLPSRSDSGSHLHFHSDDSEDEDDDGGSRGSDLDSLHHHDVISPLHHLHQQ